MTKYTSNMKDIIYRYVNLKKLEQHWNISYEQYLRTFERYCIKHYNNPNYFTQEMIDSWCIKRENELNKSYNSRIAVISSFIKFTNSRKITDLKSPSLLKPEKLVYVPHAFTQNELNNFFYACDNLKINKNTKDEQNRKLTLPIFFRLLYCTGMRTTEARLLKVEDIDLSSGIISIKKSKSNNEHYVVLNDLMKNYLVDYDKKINILYPNRLYFFPARNNNHHQKDWVSKNFKNCWNQYNNSHAIAYDLRHHYAITNINSWVNKGIEFNDKLYYLSKSMGHSSIESTKYYYSLIPRMSDIFKVQINNTFNSLVPEVKDND